MTTLGYHIALALLTLVFLSTAQAQLSGSCGPAEAEAYLDINNVRALILNDGALFWRGGSGVYVVPKDEGKSATFAYSLWVGGLVNDALRTAATRYQNYEFWPGPLDAMGNPPKDCTLYDHIYEITSEEIATYNASGIASDNLRDWPWHLGAPVIDGDKNPDNYNLEGGDRPALIGDQMLWWVMNDVGNVHESTGTPPIGLEVHVSAFAYDVPNALGDITFYRYKLIYKGASPLTQAWIGFYADNDLGNFDDDFVASDTTLDLGYTYNGDEEDEGSDGYGTPPPAIGFTVLKGPVGDQDGRDNNRNGVIDEIGERLGMESFACYIKSGGTYGEPLTGIEYYNCLRGLWRNGDPIWVGGNGTGEGFQSWGTTRFLFPGDPVSGAFWTMENIDSTGAVHASFDSRFSTGSGPFTMHPGGEQEFTIAIVWARGEDRLDSVRKMKEEVVKTRNARDMLLRPSTSFILSDPPPPERNTLLSVAQNYPNPFSQTTTIRYALPHLMYVRLTVFDVLGREVATLVNQRQKPAVYEVPFDGTDLPGGVYFYRIEMDHLSTTHSMLLIY